MNVAISYRYPNIYSNSIELKADYTLFKPEVDYWSDLTGEIDCQLCNKLFGVKRFQVRLPDAVVVVASNGDALYSRRCGENRWCSPEVLPDRPALGVVGTVQDGPPDYDVARGFSIRWVDGSEGSVFISGHCFAAFSSSQKPALRISAPLNHDTITIGGQYGYRLVAIKDVKRADYASLKISEQEFRQAQTCDQAARSAWPNVGGASWKR